MSRMSHVFKPAGRKSFMFGVDHNDPGPRLTHGPSLRVVGGVDYYLKEEIKAAREAISQLDQEVANSHSFREKASKLLEEAHRALSRLEQAVASVAAPELIVIACEIKVSARRGLTLVDVYGGYSTLGKMMTLMMRKSIYAKFDKVTEHLKSLIAPDTADKPDTRQRRDELGRASTRNPPGPGLAAGAAASIGAPVAGAALRQGKHDRVHCINYVPVTALSSDYICIWWSAGQTLEFYSEASMSTTGFSIDKPSLVVTAVAIDDDGNVWTGHMKGLVRVRQKQQWDYIAEDKCFNVGIKCIAFDSQGQAWIGDEAGSTKVLRYEAASSWLEVVASLQPSQLMSPKAQHNSSSSCKGLRLFSKFSSKAHEAAGSGDGPVHCIHVAGDRAWIAGGRCKFWISLWSSTTYQELDVYDCAGFGACHAMQPLDWQHVTAQQLYVQQQQLQRKMLDGSGAAMPPSKPPCTWRLLTGHENGQLLLWHPEAERLAPLLKIGDQFSPVRGLMVFEEYSLVVSAHMNGELVVFLRPNFDILLTPGGGAGGRTQALGNLRPKKFHIKAHKSTMHCMVGYGTSCVTASSLGTIRLWHAKDIAAEAERQGLMPERSAAAAANARRLSHGPSTLLSGELSNAISTSSTADVKRSSSNLDLSPGNTMQPPGRGESAEVQSASSQHSRRGSGHARAVSGGNMDNISTQVSTSSSLQSSPATASTSLMNEARSGDGSSSMFMGTCQTIESSELSLKKLIGQGAYGKVWLAEWTGCQVAVKELVGFTGNPDDQRAWQEMQNEVHLLGALSHPNIMRFMAVSLDPPMIVMQYYPHGSLFDLLSRGRHGNPRAVKELSWNKRLDMLRDVAAGMHYLHTRRPPVIHGDLRSPNLLLDLTIDKDRPRFHVKIADFGLARMLGVASTVVNVSKTTNPRWTAPEVIRDSQIGPAGDVYSFAIIMWEMLTWQQPFEEMMSVQVIFSTVSENTRPEIPHVSELPGKPGCSFPLYKQLMERCWSPNSKERPTFKQIVDFFQGMRDLEIKYQADQAAAARKAAAIASGTDASPMTDAPLMRPADPAVEHANGTASNSGSSTRSDRSGLAAAAAARGDGAAFANSGAPGYRGAKDSASSIVPQDADTKTVAAAAALSKALEQPAGNLYGMHRIVEERSTSLDASVGPGPSSRATSRTASGAASKTTQHSGSYSSSPFAQDALLPGTSGSGSSGHSAAATRQQQPIRQPVSAFSPFAQQQQSDLPTSPFSPFAQVAMDDAGPNFGRRASMHNERRLSEPGYAMAHRGAMEAGSSGVDVPLVAATAPTELGNTRDLEARLESKNMALLAARNNSAGSGGAGRLGSISFNRHIYHAPTSRASSSASAAGSSPPASARQRQQPQPSRAGIAAAASAAVAAATAAAAKAVGSPSPLSSARDRPPAAPVPGRPGLRDRASSPLPPEVSSSGRTSAGKHRRASAASYTPAASHDTTAQVRRSFDSYTNGSPRRALYASNSNMQRQQSPLNPFHAAAWQQPLQDDGQLGYADHDASASAGAAGAAARTQHSAPSAGAVAQQPHPKYRPPRSGPYAAGASETSGAMYTPYGTAAYAVASSPPPSPPRNSPNHSTFRGPPPPPPSPPPPPPRGHGSTSHRPAASAPSSRPSAEYSPHGDGNAAAPLKYHHSNSGNGRTSSRQDATASAARQQHAPSTSEGHSQTSPTGAHKNPASSPTSPPWASRSSSHPNLSLEYDQHQQQQQQRQGLRSERSQGSYGAAGYGSSPQSGVLEAKRAGPGRWGHRRQGSRGSDISEARRQSHGGAGSHTPNARSRNASPSRSSASSMKSANSSSNAPGKSSAGHAVPHLSLSAGSGGIQLPLHSPTYRPTGSGGGGSRDRSTTPKGSSGHSTPMSSGRSNAPAFGSSSSRGMSPVKRPLPAAAASRPHIAAAIAQMSNGSFRFDHKRTGGTPPDSPRSFSPMASASSALSSIPSLPASAMFDEPHTSAPVAAVRSFPSSLNTQAAMARLPSDDQPTVVVKVPETYSWEDSYAGIVVTVPSFSAAKQAAAKAAAADGPETPYLPLTPLPVPSDDDKPWKQPDSSPTVATAAVAVPAAHSKAWSPFAAAASSSNIPGADQVTAPLYVKATLRPGTSPNSQPHSPFAAAAAMTAPAEMDPSPNPSWTSAPFGVAALGIVAGAAATSGISGGSSSSSATKHTSPFAAASSSPAAPVWSPFHAAAGIASEQPTQAPGRPASPFATAATSSPFMAVAASSPFAAAAFTTEDS